MRAPRRAEPRRADPAVRARAPATPETERRRRDARASIGARPSTPCAELHPGAPVARQRRRDQRAPARRRRARAAPAPGPRPEPAVASRSSRRCVRVGRVADRFTYAPLIVKNCEVVEAALDAPDARGSPGAPRSRARRRARRAAGCARRHRVRAPRCCSTHATRVLEAMGRGDPRPAAAWSTATGRVWWLALAGDDYPRVNLAPTTRTTRASSPSSCAHERYAAGEGPFPTAPYWHRECPDVPVRADLPERSSRPATTCRSRGSPRVDQQLAAARARGDDARATGPPRPGARADRALAPGGRGDVAPRTTSGGPSTSSTSSSTARASTSAARRRARSTLARWAARPPTSRSTSTWRATTTPRTSGARR